MSDSVMPLDEAREWVAQDKSTRSTARAARTIVHQAEQIERLQAVVRRVDVLLGNELIDSLTLVGGLLPGDMEAPA